MTTVNNVTISDEEQNKQNVITLAGKVYKILMEYMNKAGPEERTPQKRYEMLYEKYKAMFDTFPTVMSAMAISLVYSEKAFRRLLDKLEILAKEVKEKPQEHGKDGKNKSMIQFAESHALYSKYLYVETCKARGKHYNPKTARKIYEDECTRLISIVHNIEKKEKEAKSEFEAENKKHDEERRNELLQWLSNEKQEMKKNDPEKYEKIKEESQNITNEALKLIKEMDEKEKEKEKEKEDNSALEEYKKDKEIIDKLSEQISSMGETPIDAGDMKTTITQLEAQLQKIKQKEEESWLDGTLIDGKNKQKGKKSQ